MAYFALWAGAVLVDVLALYELFKILKNTRSCIRFQNAFLKSHQNARSKQTAVSSVILFSIAAAAGIFMGIWDRTVPGLMLFFGVAAGFAALAVKYWISGRVLITPNEFVWKDQKRSFRSITNFSTQSRIASITFKNEKPVDLPSAVGLLLQADWTRKLK